MEELCARCAYLEDVMSKKIVSDCIKTIKLFAKESIEADTIILKNIVIKSATLSVTVPTLNVNVNSNVNVSVGTMISTYTQALVNINTLTYIVSDGFSMAAGSYNLQSYDIMLNGYDSIIISSPQIIITSTGNVTVNAVSNTINAASNTIKVATNTINATYNTINATYNTINATYNTINATYNTINVATNTINAAYVNYTNNYLRTFIAVSPTLTPTSLTFTYSPYQGTIIFTNITSVTMSSLSGSTVISLTFTTPTSGFPPQNNNTLMTGSNQMIPIFSDGNYVGNISLQLLLGPTVSTFSLNIPPTMVTTFSINTFTYIYTSYN